MRHIGFQLSAVISAVCLALVAAAALRPRYGGTLRVEIQARLSTLDATNLPDVAEAQAARKLGALLYDPLVRFDSNGQPQPGLALSWEHDEQLVKWRFKLRPGVEWQDGTPLAPEDVVRSLAGHTGWASVRLDAEVVEIDASRPAPDLPAELATDADLAIRRAQAATPPAEGAALLPIGTGPFRLTHWEPGNRATFQANEDYWEGRPFVDTVEILMGRASRDESLDLELGKADLALLDPVEARRAQQEGKKIWASAPVELVCLRLSANRPAVQDGRIRQALADSIDRAALQKVLWQNYGEVAGSVFPQWLSGYAFLFPAALNLDGARQALGQMGGAQALRMGYDPGDTLARETAERVAVNAREAGLTLSLVPLTPASKLATMPSVDLVVQRVRMEGPSLGEAIEEVAAQGLTLSAEPASPEQAYGAERQFLEARQTIPLIHIPELMEVGPRVMHWSGTPWGDWRLERVWLGGEKP